MARWERGLWKDVPREARVELRDLYARLRRQYGPFGRAGLGRRWAKLVAEAWFATDAASSAAVGVVVKRQQGRGRRPNVSRVNQALKRQGIGIGALVPMLDRLQALTKPNGNGGPPPIADLVRRGGA